MLNFTNVFDLITSFPIFVYAFHIICIYIQRADLGSDVDDDIEDQPRNRANPHTIYDASPEMYEAFNINSEDTEFVANGKKFKVKLPKSHQVISKSTLSAYKNQVKLWKQMKNKFKFTGRGRYNGSTLGKQAFGTAMALNPEASGETMELTVALCWMALLADVGLIDKISTEQIAKTAPSYSTMNRTVANVATDCIYLERKRILDNKSKVGIGSDKGGKVHLGHNHLIKQLSYSLRSNQELFGWLLRRFIPDIDDSGGTSEECADGVVHALSRMVLGDDFKLYASTTDSGGGGTGHKFFQEMEKRGITCEGILFLISFCTLHTLQLVFANAVKGCIGEGGLSSGSNEDGNDGSNNVCIRNAMQLLHAVFYLQNIFEDKEWKLMWDDALEDEELVGLRDQFQEGNVDKKLQAPILTRWWSVGVAVKQILKNKDVLSYMCQKIVNANNASTKANKVASQVQSLLHEEVIISDLKLLKGFCEYFFDENFKWMQQSDDLVGLPSCYLSRHIVTRYFIMHEELKRGTNGGWKNIDEMKDFKESVDGMEDQDFKRMQERKGSLFYDKGLKSLNNHYIKWIDPLLIVSVFGEAPTAKCVSQVLLGDTDSRLADNQAVFTSPFHGKDINLNDFKAFIQSKTGRKADEIRNGSHLTQTIGLQDLRLIANGLDIWGQPGIKSSDRNADAQRLIDKFFMNFAFLKSSTHDIEAAVKEANFISKANRSEVANSHRIAVRSFILPYANDVAKKAMIKEYYETKGKVHNESKHKMKIRGTQKVLAVLDKVMEINEEIGDAREEDPIWKTIHERNSKSSESFEKKRVEKKVARYKDKKNKEKRQNKVQKENGMDFAPLVLGLIPIGKLTKDLHLNALIEEAKARGISQINNTEVDKMGIKELKKAIQNHEKAQHQESGETRNYDKRYFRQVSDANAVNFDSYFLE